MKRRRAAWQGGQVTAFPDMRYRIMKSPGGFTVGRELLMGRSAPLLKHRRHLRDGQYTGVNCPNHEVMGNRIRDGGFLVATDALILLTAHVGQTTYGGIHNSWQVPFNKPRMAASDGHLATKREIVTNEHRTSERDRRRERPVMRVTQSHHQAIVTT